MFSSLEELRKYRFIIPLILVIGFVAAALLVSYLIGVNKYPGLVWNGLVPGQTTTDEVKVKLGEPNSLINISNNLVLLSYTDSRFRAKIYLKGSVVLLIKVPSTVLKDINLRNKSLRVTYSGDYAFSKIVLDLESGVGAVLDDASNNVSEIWYFEPDAYQEVSKRISIIDELLEQRPVHKELDF